MTRSKPVLWFASSLRLAIAITSATCVLWTIAPPAPAQTYTVLHSFSGSDGSYPLSTLIFDRAGNLYGTTEFGGASGQGVVFQLKHTPSGGWIYTPIHDFNLTDGANPIDYGGLTLASDGTIYGTTNAGGILG
ncbi:MAG: choice-of-anchor tandem repeat GloVer-containing protein, partial [Candidatus Korobacteraceae bacterium]